jgi:hypothetical protein
VQEEILNRIVKSGIAQTKSEAIRMAVLKFAQDLGLVNSRMLVETIREDLSKDKKTAEEILKGIKRAKEESISG